MKSIRLIAAAAACFMLFSCSKNNKKKEVRILEGGKVELYDAEESDANLKDSPQVWHPGDSKICVLYGYGFNDQEFVQAMNERLSKKYGLSNDGGRILYFVFPDDFMYGKKPAINKLADKISGENVQGIVLLGAPENCHSAISRIQDQHEEDSYFPVISLFPQDDDITGMEDSADIVIDHVQKADMTGTVSENDSSSFAAKVPSIIENAISIEIAAKTPLVKDAKLYNLVKEMALGTKVSRYADPDTNLISINHFVLE